MAEQTELILHIIHQFKQFHAMGQLHLIPRGELTLLLELEQGGGENGMTVSELAQRLQVSPPAVSRSLRHLREKGFIADRMDPADRRALRLTVSQAGREALQADMHQMDLFAGRVLSRLEPGELQEFSRVLDKLSDSLHHELQALRKKEDPCEKS